MTKEEFLKLHQDNPFIRDKCDCGKEISLQQLKKGLPRNKMIYCSRSCAAKDKKSLEKRKMTNLNKYGVDHPMKSEEGLNSFKKSMLQKYNVEFAQQSEVIKETTIKNNIKKYGVQNPMMIKNVSDKAMQKQFPYVNRDVTSFILDNFNDDIISKEEYLQILEKSNYKTPDGLRHYIKRHNIQREKTGINDSLYETEIIEYIKSLGIDEVYQGKYDIIQPKQLDIYIPSKNLAIEFDGIRWHCNKFKDKKYHLEKTELCESKGIQLLHIFENEWLDAIKKKIWKSVIKHKLGLTENKIPARKCKIVEISNKVAREFCEQNHLQGGIKGPINLGLFYEGDLVQVAVIAKPRFNKNYKYELLRLCSKLDTTVIGGASKLLKKYSSLISYANRRWSVGNVYNRSGFKLLNISDPNYFYVINHNLESRNKWQKHKLKNKLEFFDENLTEMENMKLNGINWIYDCGNMVFVK